MSRGSHILDDVLQSFSVLNTKIRVGLRGGVDLGISPGGSDSTLPPELLGIVELADTGAGKNSAGVVVGQLYDPRKGWRDVVVCIYDVDTAVNIPMYIQTCQAACIAAVRTSVEAGGR